MSREERRKAERAAAKEPPEAGQVVVAVLVPLHGQESHIERVLRLLKQWGYPAAPMTGAQVLEAAEDVREQVRAAAARDALSQSQSQSQESPDG